MAEHVRSEADTESLLSKLKYCGNNIEIEFQCNKTSTKIYDCPEEFRECGLPTDLVAVIHSSLGSQRGNLLLLSSKIKKEISEGNFRKDGLPGEVVRDLIDYAQELSEEDFFALVQYSQLQGKTDERKCLEFRLVYPQINEQEIYARMQFKKGQSRLKNEIVDLTDCMLKNSIGNDVTEEIILRIEAPIANTVKQIYGDIGKNVVVYTRQNLRKRIIQFNMFEVLKKASDLEIEYYAFQEYPPFMNTENWNSKDIEEVIKIISARRSRSN